MSVFFGPKYKGSTVRGQKGRRFMIVGASLLGISTAVITSILYTSQKSMELLTSQFHGNPYTADNLLIYAIFLLPFLLGIFLFLQGTFIVLLNWIYLRKVEDHE